MILKESISLVTFDQIKNQINERACKLKGYSNEF